MTEPTKGTVLVVEDDPQARKLYAIQLREAGFSALEARDCSEALALAAHEMPDVVLQDLVLPDAPQGALLGALRRMPRGAHVPVIAMSGMRSRLEDAWSAQLGYAGLLLKPFEANQLIQAVAACAEGVRSSGLQRFAGARVMVVDDQNIQRRLLCAHLRDWGLTPLPAGSDAEAVELANRSLPRAIVIDVMMPGLGGYGLCRRLRENPALDRTPIVLVSAASSEESDREEARAAGANALVMGTPDFWGLRAALDEALEASARNLS